MRIVLIEGRSGKFIDAEACGGLHVEGMEQAIGTIKIIDTERISDGVDRIEFVAGEAALDYFRKLNEEISDSALKLNSDPFKISEKISTMDEENRKMRKQAQEYKDMMAESIATSLAGHDKVEKELNMPKEVLRMIATKASAMNSKAVVLLKNPQGDVVCVAGEKSGANALEFIRDSAKGKKFVGGGSQKFAEGKII